MSILNDGVGTYPTDTCGDPGTTHPPQSSDPSYTYSGSSNQSDPDYQYRY
jgi:hypothetical protein